MAVRPLVPLAPCPKVTGAHSKAPYPEGMAMESVRQIHQHHSGTVLVIGANEGKLPNDPTFAALESSALAHLNKVFVEPIPRLFRVLESNIRTVPRATAVNAAISDSRDGRGLDMYCLEAPKKRRTRRRRLAEQLDATWSGGGPPQPPRAARGLFGRRLKQKSSQSSSTEDKARWWWKQICSFERSRLFSECTLSSGARTPAHIHMLSLARVYVPRALADGRALVSRVLSLTHALVCRACNRRCTF